MSKCDYLFFCSFYTKIFSPIPGLIPASSSSSGDLLLLPPATVPVLLFDDDKEAFVMEDATELGWQHARMALKGKNMGFFF